MSDAATDKAPPLSVEELRLLAEREKNRQDKVAQRARKATEHAASAMAPNPNGYVVPSVPAGLSAIRKWLRQQHDAYSQRRLGVFELTECRRTMASLADSYRASADLRKAEAAIRAAEAQERMADVLAQVEHGGAAVALLARLRELPGEARRPLPWRVPTVPASSAPAEKAGT